MSSLTAVVYVGERPPLGGGLQPRMLAHLYEGGVPRFVAYEVDADGSGPPRLDPLAGAYAPPIESDPSYPITDLLLATYREGSAITQRLDVLSEKARANYGRDFQRMVFASDVEWGSDGFGRLFEARSQLEAHPYDAAVWVGFHAGVDTALEDAITANLDRLDAPTASFGPK